MFHVKHFYNILIHKYMNQKMSGTKTFLYFLILVTCINGFPCIIVKGLKSCRMEG